MKLDKRVIDAARYERESGAHYLWDTATTGFGLRIYPSGKKSFVVTYRVRGRQRFMTVGPYGVFTLHEARKEAKRLLALARLGEDPSGKRLEDLRSPKMTDLAERYMKEHAHVNKKPATAKTDQRIWDRIILERFGQRRVKDIQREDVATLHSSLRDKPGMANIVLSILSKAFNLAEVWGWRREGSNPCRHVQLYKIKSRERFLSDSELGRLSETLAEAERLQTEKPQVIAALRLLVLTGCRVSEILKLRWEDVDFERRCLTLPDSKTGPKTVYLNAPALQVLARIERVDGNEHVIPGRYEGTPLTSLDSMWKRIRRRAGLEDVRVHDLRHSFASFGVGLGLPLQQVGKLLGHSQIATTERYAHLADDPIRQANERIGDHIWAVMSGKPKAEVVAITDGKRATGS
jgi:integrase